jgi:hypothetical protein
LDLRRLNEDGLQFRWEMACRDSAESFAKDVTVIPDYGGFLSAHMILEPGEATRNEKQGLYSKKGVVVLVELGRVHTYRETNRANFFKRLFPNLGTKIE